MLIRQSSITSASNFPPPMVPQICPASSTSIFDPASRGTEPLVAATVASAHGLRARRARSNSSKMMSVIAHDAAFDLAMRFIRRNKQLVFVFDSERRQIDQQTMFVRHREIDARDFRACIERGFAHLKHRRLSRGAVVFC